MVHFVLHGGYMLHNKRSKTLQIRVSEQELADILKYTQRFPGFSASTVLRALILGAVYEYLNSY